MADQVIQDIKDRVDIVELIGSYLTLKRAGVNWKANCPFHNEKSPSFNVNPTRQIWHCFGCGEGGDIFTFIQKHEHLDFPETLKLLAGRAGVVLPERSSQSSVRKDWKDKAYQILDFTTKYYHAVLESNAGSKAREYLLGRGLSNETLKDWQIGFAPDRFQVLEAVLDKKGVSLEELVKAGLVVRAEAGRTYDRFYGRITFPIKDFQGKVVGFSARLVQDRQQAAKYVNSSESDVYHKSEVLFGLFQAKKAIAKLGEVVVVEGQMDCIKAHQAGFVNTVASSGTALTEYQLKLLHRLCDQVSFAFDADSAGQQALYRASLLALAQGMDVKVISYTGAKDPDELISKDQSLWVTALAEGLAVVDYYIALARQQFAPQSLEQRRFVASTVLPLVVSLKSQIDKDHYLQSVSRAFGIDLASLRQELKNITTNPQVSVGAVADVLKDQATQGSLLRKNNHLEQFVLGSLKFPEVLKLFVEMGQPDYFTNFEYRALAESLAGGMELGEEQKLILQEAEFVVESLSDEFGGDQDRLLLELLRIFDTFRLTGLKQQQEHITFQLQAAEAVKDQVLVHALRKDFAALMAQRLELERKTQNT